MTRRIIAALCCALVLAACGAQATIAPDDVIAKFKAAGLEAEQSSAMDAKAYGMAPLLCQEGARRFLIPSLGEDNGGRLFVCNDAGDAAKLKTYYDELGKASALFHSWTYQKGGIVLQLNGSLDQAKADAYGKVVAGL